MKFINRAEVSNEKQSTECWPSQSGETQNNRAKSNAAESNVAESKQIRNFLHLFKEELILLQCPTRQGKHTTDLRT